MPAVDRRARQLAAARASKIAAAAAAAAAAADAQAEDGPAPMEGVELAPRRPWDVAVQDWDDVARECAEWEATCAAIFGAMRRCGLCGVVMLSGGTAGAPRRTMAPMTRANAEGVLVPLPAPPYALGNIYARGGTVDAAGRWNLCEGCHTSKDWARAHAVNFSPAYLGLFFRCSHEERMLCGVLDARLDITRKLSGAEACSSGVCILDGPIVRWSPEGAPSCVSPQLVALFRYNYLRNPLYTHNLACVEMDHPTYGVPVLGLEAIEDIIRPVAERDPLNGADERAAACNNLLATFVSLAPNRRATEMDEFSLLAAGTLRRRSASMAQRALLVTVDGLVPVPADDADDATLTLESALSPFLFPDARGMYLGARPEEGTMAKYFKRRVGALFSPFTLHLPYPLLMSQILRARRILVGTQRGAMERDLQRQRRRFPHLPFHEAVRHVIKHTIPAKVRGSPSWWRSNLEDLYALVAAHGLPHFFLTITADDCSNTKCAPRCCCSRRRRSDSLQPNRRLARRRPQVA